MGNNCHVYNDYNQHHSKLSKKSINHWNKIYVMMATINGFQYLPNDKFCRYEDDNDGAQDYEYPLLWRHNGRDGVSNNQPHDIVYSAVHSVADQRKHQSSASRASVRGIHRWPVNSPDKWPVTREMFPFDDVIMSQLNDECDDWKGARLRLWNEEVYST